MALVMSEHTGQQERARAVVFLPCVLTGPRMFDGLGDRLRSFGYNTL